MTEPSYLRSTRTAYDAVAADYAEAVIPTVRSRRFSAPTWWPVHRAKTSPH